MPAGEADRAGDGPSRAARATRTAKASSSATAQRLFYEVYGEGEETVFLLPTWSLVHSRHWKMQIPYLARHFRVLVMDGLGNGRSDRCRDPRPLQRRRVRPRLPRGDGRDAARSVR